MATRLHLNVFVVSLAATSLALMAQPSLAQLLPNLSKADAGAGKKLDLTLVPSDAVAAFVIQPRRVLTNPAMPPQLLALLDKSQTGFDVRDLEQVMAIVLVPQSAQWSSDFPGVAILRFAMPTDLDAIAAKFSPDGSASQIGGTKMRLGHGPRDISCATLDDRMLLVSDKSGLQLILAAKPADSPLRKLLAAATDSPEVQAFVATAQLRSSLDEAKNDVPALLIMLRSFTGQIGPIDSLVASATLTPKGGMQLQITAAAPNEQSAQEAETNIKQLLETGKNAFLAQVNGAKGPNSPPIDFGSLANNVVSALRPTHNGNRVEVHVDVQSASATIGMATALLLPAVQASREAAARNSDANNLHQIGIAIMNYEDERKRLPARAIFDKEGKPLLSWRVMILPEIEEAELYKQFHLDEPWDSENNKKLLDKMPAALKHPKFDKPGMTVYQAVVGKGFAFEGNEGTKLASFVDGASKTIMVVESAPDKAVPWTKPDDWQPDGADPTMGLGGLFAGNLFNVVFADAHVEGIAKPIDPNLFKALLTRNGREPIPAR